VSEAVLDSSAVLALVNAEPGKDAVTAIIQDSALCSLNLTEVVTRLLDLGMPGPSVVSSVQGLSCEILPFDEQLALQAGILRSTTRHAGLSLGDRACLALARRLRVPALTADRRWAGLEVGVDIRMIRP